MKEERNEWEESNNRCIIIREKQSTGEKDIEKLELRKRMRYIREK